MAYNLGGLIKRVQIDKLDDDEYEPEVITNFINDTIRDIYTKTELPFQEKIFTGSIPVGSNMFKLPKDVSVIQNGSVNGVTRFFDNQMRYQDFISRFPDAINEKAGAPSYWTTYADNIILSAPTDKEYFLTIYYLKQPNKLVETTDVPDIPEEFEEIIVLGAYKKVLDRDESNDISNIVQAEYQAKLNDMVNRYGMRMTNRPIQMMKG